MRPPVSTTDAPMYRPPDGNPLALAALAAAAPAAAVAVSYPGPTAALAGLVLAAFVAGTVGERLLAGRTRETRVCVPGTDVCVAV